MPFFSILIPSYNRPEYISGLLDSIFESNFDDFEVIISDDFSPKQQEIKKIITQYDPTKIKTYFHQINSGESLNKKFLVSKASGKFNILIGDDDRFTQSGLSSLYSFISENPNHDVYTFGYNIIDEDNNIISKYKAPRQINISVSKDQYLYDLYCADMLPLWIFHPSTFCCRAGIEKEIEYKNNVGMAEDLFFIFEVVASEYSLIVIPDIMFEWRKIQIVSKSEQINQSSKFLADLSARVKIFDCLANDSLFEGKIREFSMRTNFQYRFLIKTLVSDNKITNNLIKNKFLGNNLGFSKNALIEFINMSYISKITFRYSLLAIRLLKFLKIFGVFNTILFIFNLLKYRKIKYAIQRILSQKI